MTGGGRRRFNGYIGVGRAATKQKAETWKEKK